MSDVNAVIGLLEQWRDATGMQRVRIGVEATRTIGALPAARKRALAVEVAQRVAPQLVPAIESETGDLSPQQIGAVIDLLRRADREQLDDLVEALRGGDVLGALDLVDGAVDIVAPPDPTTAALLDDITEPDAPHELGELPPPVAVGAGTVGAVRAAAAAAPSPTAPSPAATAIADVAAEIEALDEDAVEDLRAEVEAAARAGADRWRDTTRDVPARPAYRAPDMHFGGSFDDIELPDTSVEEVAPLAERRDELPGVAASPTTAPTPRAPLSAGPVTAVLAAVTATPDGYRRRRAALAAIREGRMVRGDVAAVVASFARDTDRSWVTGAALDAGLVGAADLDDLPLSPAARSRLGRRAR